MRENFGQAATYQGGRSCEGIAGTFELASSSHSTEADCPYRPRLTSVALPISQRGAPSRTRIDQIITAIYIANLLTSVRLRLLSARGATEPDHTRAVYICIFNVARLVQCSIQSFMQFDTVFTGRTPSRRRPLLKEPRYRVISCCERQLQKLAFMRA